MDWEYRLTLQIMVPVPAHQLLLEHLDLVVQNNGSLAVAAVVVTITTVAVLPLMVVGVEDLVEQVVILPQDHQVCWSSGNVPTGDAPLPSSWDALASTMKGVQQHMELVVAVVALLGPTQVLMLEVMVVLVLLVLLDINYQQMQQLMIHQLKQLVEQPM